MVEHDQHWNYFYSKGIDMGSPPAWVPWSGAAGTGTSARSPSAEPLQCRFLLVALGFSGS